MSDSYLLHQITTTEVYNNPNITLNNLNRERDLTLITLITLVTLVTLMYVCMCIYVVLVGGLFQARCLSDHQRRSGMCYSNNLNNPDNPDNGHLSLVLGQTGISYLSLSLSLTHTHTHIIFMLMITLNIYIYRFMRGLWMC